MRIQIKRSTVAYFACIVLFSEWEILLCSLLTLLIHELGHYCAGIAFGEKAECIELTPLGGVMKYPDTKPPFKGVRGAVIAAAGPAANYLFILCITQSGSQRILGNSLMRKLIISNLSMSMLNLIPALPLDGGRIIFSIAFFLLRASTLIRILTVSGITSGLTILAVALYGSIKLKTLNCSLVFIGIFLLVYAQKSKLILLAENTYTLIQERLARSDRIRISRIILTSPDTPLYMLLDSMVTETSALIFAYELDNQICFIGEKQICTQLLHNPDKMLFQLQRFCCSVE